MQEDSAAFSGDMHPMPAWHWGRHRIEMPVKRRRDKTLVRVSHRPNAASEDLSKLFVASADRKSTQRAGTPRH